MPWQPPMWYDRLGGIAWRAIAIVVFVGIIVFGLIAFSVVILPVLLGLLFTCALQPVSQSLERRRVPHSLAAALAVLVLLALMVAVVWLTVNAVVDQWPEIEALIEEGRATLVDAADDVGLELDAAATLDDHVGEAVGTVVGTLLGGLFGLVPTVAGIITTLVLSLFVTFFFIKDGVAMWRWVVSRTGDERGLVERIGWRVWTSLTGYVLGQSAIAAVDAALIAAGALILGVPEAGAILVITFFGAFVPYIGATVAGFVAVILAVSDGGVGRGLVMLAVVLGVQVLEGNVLQPWIQGRAVRLHPMIIALSVVAGGALAGFLGVLLAVPIAAAVVVALSELRAAGVVGPGTTRATESSRAG
jgi:predicted PurR-regulated permease PerM